MQAPTGEQALGQGFDLNSYRSLLERLQASKRNKEKLDKEVPSILSMQESTDDR